MSAIKIWPSADEISAPSESDKLIELAGIPMLSINVSICDGGMTCLISSSISTKRRSVSSIRVPGWPRACSLMRPASTDGKKSWPSSGNRLSDATNRNRNAPIVMPRCLSASAR